MKIKLKNLSFSVQGLQMKATYHLNHCIFRVESEEVKEHISQGIHRKQKNEKMFYIWISWEMLE